MKPTELRLGNIIKLSQDTIWIEEYKKSGKIDEIITKVDSSTIQGVLFHNENNRLYEPIILTEEWLKNFGFQQDEKDTTWFHGATRWIEVEKDKIFAIQFGYGSPDSNSGYTVIWGFNIHIKYVHQLQNLYFAITGDELVLAVTAKNEK